MATFTVELTRDWPAFVVSVLSVIITLGAVIVALYGPRWRAAKRRPLVTLHADEDEWEWIYDAAAPREATDKPWLTVHNAVGRDPARGVEVFASIESDISIEGHRLPMPHIDREPLLFSSPLQALASAVSSVPPGFARRVYLVVLGDRERIYAAMPPSREGRSDVMGAIVGALAVHPWRKENAHWIVADAEYRTRLWITGDNFDAVAYEGSFAVERADMGAVTIDSESGAFMEKMVSLKFVWTTALQRLPAREASQPMDAF